jgi:hypothetical protein
LIRKHEKSANLGQKSRKISKFGSENTKNQQIWVRNHEKSANLGQKTRKISKIGLKISQKSLCVSKNHENTVCTAEKGVLASFYDFFEMSKSFLEKYEYEYSQVKKS